MNYYFKNSFFLYIKTIHRISYIKNDFNAYYEFKILEIQLKCLKKTANF